MTSAPAAAQLVDHVEHGLGRYAGRGVGDRQRHLARSRHRSEQDRQRGQPGLAFSMAAWSLLPEACSDASVRCRSATSVFSTASRCR